MAKVKDDDFSMAKEYIEREAFKRHIQAISHSPNDQFSAGSVINLINKAPAVDVAPVVHGLWDWDKSGLETSHKFCSVCGCDENILTYKRQYYNYCPNCGAKMDLEEQP